MKPILSTHQCRFCHESWTTRSDNKEEFEFYDIINKMTAVNHVMNLHVEKSYETFYVKC